MKLSKLTVEQVDTASRLVRREAMSARAFALNGDRQAAYAAAERAEQAAFDLKQLFALEPDEIEEGVQAWTSAGLGTIGT